MGFLVCIKWIVFNPLMTGTTTLVTITNIMNHKQIIIESGPMNTDSGYKEHVLLNKGTLTTLMGVMEKIEEFCLLFYYPAC